MQRCHSFIWLFVLQKKNGYSGFFHLLLLLFDDVAHQLTTWLLKGVAVSGFSIPIYSCKFVPRIILVSKSFILQPPLFLQTQTSLFNFENGTSFSNLSPYNRSGIELSSEGQRTHQLDARPIRNALFFFFKR